jgi:hypothetical protein
MCRTGGRRCPSHTDPTKVAAYNERRRLLYNLKVKLNHVQPVEDFTSRFNAFPIDALRKRISAVEAAVFHSEAVKFSKTLIPDYNEKTAEDTRWVVDHDYYDRNLDKNEALIFYTSSGYKMIRNYLNSGLHETPDWDNPEYTNTIFGQHQEWFSDNIETTDKALALAEPPEEPRLVYRGMKLGREIKPEDLDSWWAENFTVGSVVSQKNYMSTSLNPEVSISHFSNHAQRDTETPEEAAKRSVIIEIMSKQGAPLGYGTSTMGEVESEVLMPRNAKFKVVSVNHNVSVPFERKERFDQTSVNYARRTIIRMVDVSDEN